MIDVGDEREREQHLNNSHKYDISYLFGIN